MDLTKYKIYIDTRSQDTMALSSMNRDGPFGSIDEAERSLSEKERRRNYNHTDSWLVLVPDPKLPAD
jgi:hypothetical protein